MDFSSLLHVAQKNEKNPKSDVRYYSTKFEPPKKEERSKQLSDNIKKFLARKEAEEKKKAVEARIKKEELLALRSQDKKATRRVSVMLKRTKSANKSVLEDAVDNDNTAVTLAGPSQPDEDDYGYVSQEASAFYNKMMAKYSNMPEEPKLFSSSKKNSNTNLSSTKDRVRAALLREQEEALLPHKRKRRTKKELEKGETEDDKELDDTQDDAEDVVDREVQEKPKPKPKPPPPALDFQALLKLAEKKQFEPIKIEPKKKSDDDDLLMTKRQRREYEKERAWKEQREKRREAMEANERKLDGKPGDSNSRSAMPPPNKIPRLESKPSGESKNAMPPPNKIPKLNNSTNGIKVPKLSNSDNRSKDLQKSDVNNIKKSECKVRFKENNLKPEENKSSKLRSELEKPYESKNKLPSSSSVHNQNRSTVNNKVPEKYSKEIIRSNDDRKILKKDVSSKDINKSRASLTNSPKPRDDVRTKPLSSKPKEYPPTNSQSKPLSASSERPKQYPPSESRAKQPMNDLRQKKTPLDVRPKQLPPSDVRPKQLPPSDVRPKQFPPSDARSKQFPPSDVRPKKLPPSDARPKQFPPSDVRPKQFPPSDVRPKQFPPPDVRPKQFPPADVRPKQFPPSDVRRKQFPPGDIRRRPPPKKQPMGHKRRILDDDDSEYDSEMDDFIDDGPEEGEDYSKYISEIFGYDKSRYRDVPEDDDGMESSYSQMLKEEFISTKIGLMEDLEDMRQEAEEKKKKAAVKKGIIKQKR